MTRDAAHSLAAQSNKGQTHGNLDLAENTRPFLRGLSAKKCGWQIHPHPVWILCILPRSRPRRKWPGLTQVVRSAIHVRAAPNDIRGNTLHPASRPLHDPSSPSPSFDLLHPRCNQGQNLAANNLEHGEFG